MLDYFFPPSLSDGGSIALVSPSRWDSMVNIDAYRKLLEERGYRVNVSEQSYQKDGILAGTDQVRAQALMQAFEDPACDAIFCIRGGTGANLILDHLDFDRIKANPKPFVGFSDITVLLNAITSRTGMITYHGPMSVSFLPERRNVPTTENLFSLIGDKGRKALITMNGVDVVKRGTAKGHLVGGNLTLLETLVGTPYDWDATNSILFIEDVGEPLYKIERSLAHLKQAGKLESIQAVLVGQMVGILDWQEDLDPDEHQVYGRELKDFVLSYIPSDIPVAFEVPCGHDKSLMTFPIGAEVEIQLNDKCCEMVVCS